MGVLGLFILGSCNSKPGNNPEEHNHGTEAHDHDHEGHDHENEGHSATEECEGHDHGSEASESEHSDEIILPKAKAEAAGVKVSTIEPGTFEQVIKTQRTSACRTGRRKCSRSYGSRCCQLSW